MKTCRNCGFSSFRELVIPYSVKTRSEIRNVVNIENLPIYECNVCGERELPQRSEDKIEDVKQMVRMEMERIAEMEQNKVYDYSYKELFSSIFNREKVKKHAH